MRRALLLMSIVFCHLTGTGQHKLTKEEATQWLKDKLTQDRSAAGDEKAQRNATAICVSCSKDLKPEQEIDDRRFTAIMTSHTSWTQNELVVRNDIFDHNKLQDSYTYHIPLNAITDAAQSNCRMNMEGFVNMYRERALFMTVKKNTTRISHVNYGGGGKGKAEREHLNTKEADMDSVIPIALCLDRNAAFREEVLSVFQRLVELNKGSNLHRLN